MYLATPGKYRLEDSELLASVPSPGDVSVSPEIFALPSVDTQNRPGMDTAKPAS